MFSKLFGAFRKSNDNTPPIDLSFGYGRHPEFVALLKKGAYEPFQEAYEPLSWDAKTLIHEGIGLDEQYADDIAKFVQQCPGSYIANLLGAVSKTRLAWIARTAARGKDVSESAAEKFIRLLEEAAELLTQADALNDEDPEICARTIRVYMGLGADEAAVNSYFDAAVSMQPNHLMAHLMMINYLSPKWSGSVEAMHAFADDRIQATGSSLLVTLKLFAFVEEWLYYSMNGETAKHKQFFAAAAVREQINTLYSQYTEEADGALLVPYVYNYFAFAFWQMGDKESARRIIQQIPGKMTIYPWAYMDINSNEALQRL